MKAEHTNTLVRWAAVLAIAAGDAFAEEKRGAEQKHGSEQKRIVVSIPDRKLVLLEGTRVLKVYDVAVGKSSTPSPVGEFQIVNRIPNPTWYAPGKVVGPGKDNPLGTRWIGLNAKGYGIHGTNVPTSIGKAASHGCIRMRKHDLEELFDRVDVGISVELQSVRPQVLALIFAIAEVV
jgi:lipoprotein-anchoring transpeptidase ErfK/SrfK